MITAIDTNILSILLSEAPQAPVINDHMGRCKQEGSVIISAVVYAEILAHPNATPAFLSYMLKKTGITTSFLVDPAIWTEAGIRFAQYAERRRAAIQESPRRLIADFLIGAHALAQADRLMTFDTAIYRRNFPELRLYEGLN